MADHRVAKRMRSSGNDGAGDDVKQLPELAGQNPRKIRIVCVDPEATDSSSDELEEGERSSPHRIVREIVLPVRAEETVEGKSWSGQPESKKFTGVRMRKWGKWAAEIRDPFARKRIWLGTFNTAEEASQVYNFTKQKFQERLAAQTPPKSSEKNPSPSGRVVSGQEPTRKSRKGVERTKSGRWGAKIYDPVKKSKVWLGTYDTEEEASNAIKSKKLEFGSKWITRPVSESGSSPKSPKSPKIEPLSETTSGTTTTTSTTSSMGEGQICQILNKQEEEKKPPWLGLGIGMLMIDNNGNLLGQFSRLDDDLRIC